MDYNFTEKAQEAFRIAQAIAKEYSHVEYGPSHLLKALLHKNVGLMSFIERMGQDPYYVE